AAQASNFITGLATDASTGWVYWSDHSPNTGFTILRSRDPTGQQGRLIAIDPIEHNFGAIAVDEVAGKVFWTSAVNNGSILRANLDGTAREAVVSDAGPNLAALVLDAHERKMYWVSRDANVGRIRGAGYDDPTIQDVVLNLLEPRGLAIDTQKRLLYWTEE